ncbi:MAG TPA: proline racemase family protein [Phycisphaerae bacterium]|nr:proline racemase family protein [Phycisphaerae bacterium]
MGLDWSRRDIRDGKSVITAVDVHAAGEPLRIITSGLPEVPGATMLERRRWMRDNADHIRRALMHEPRGHRDMYGCVVTPPVSPEADLGVLFLHNSGYSTMCGHGIIALVTALVETGAVPAAGEQTPVAIDTPAGLVRATAHLGAGGSVERVSFRNVPSFVLQRDVAVDVGDLGPVTLDIAFGGAFYAILPAEAVGLRVEVDHLPPLVRAAAAVKSAVAAAVPIEHPVEDDLGFLYGVILTDGPEDPSHHSRNLCVFADSEVDRSPTGTGVSARLALHYAKGEISEGETMVIESVLGAESVFEGRVVGLAEVGPYEAVVPEVSGRAFITGRHEFLIHPDDVLGKGFLL